MIVSANGIIFNEYSDVLLVRRDDTRTLAPPGGACELNELPPDAAAREVLEETGLRVHPVRLVGLYFLPVRPTPYLFLCFRCLPSGGQLSSSEETSQVGYYLTNPLPKRMLAGHREQVDNAFGHGGGPPDYAVHEVSPMMRAGSWLLNHLVYPWLSFRRRWTGQPSFKPPPDWQVRAVLALHNQHGEALWLKDGHEGMWHLPASSYSSGLAPWILAEHVVQQYKLPIDGILQLTSIYLRQDQAIMDFVFSARVDRVDPLAQQRAQYATADSIQVDTADITMAREAPEKQSLVKFQLLPVEGAATTTAEPIQAS